MAVNAKKLPSGSWRAQLYMGKDATGKRQYKSFTAPTKREAERLALEYVPEEIGETDPMLEMTVGEAIDRYIALKEGVASPATTLGDKRKRKNCFGFANMQNLPAASLSAAQVQLWISEFSASGKSPKYIRNAYGLLHASVSMFVPDFNPRVQLPQKQSREILIPTAEEVAQIYEDVKGTKLELPFLLASQCGLRASEAAGLRREDVDPVRRVITIKRARVTGEYGATVKAPKTSAGYRTLPCAQSLCDLCLQTKGEYVCGMDSNQISSAWSYYIKENKSKFNRTISYHALRHYFASVGILLGIPKAYLVGLMGHSSSMMIDAVYGHLFPNESERYAKMLCDRTNELLQDATRNATQC